MKDFILKSVFVIALLLILLFLYSIRNALYLFFFALVLGAGLSPVVEWLVRKNIPRGIAAAITVLLVLGSITGLLYIGLSPFVYQLQGLTSRLMSFSDYYNLDKWINFQQLQRQIGALFQQSFNILTSVMGITITLVTAFAYTAYILIYRASFYSVMKKRFPDSVRVLVKTEQKLGRWVMGQVALSLIVGTLYAVTLWLLKVDFIIPLAVFGGLMEIGHAKCLRVPCRCGSDGSGGVEYIL